MLHVEAINPENAVNPQYTVFSKIEKLISLPADTKMYSHR
ncbi:hypothetical protein MNBD_GAMMA16-1315 [hydrothermal vent metagenome]|uniref:Uncharacterized protein n=1 Tax=hydrothermal vent metagenome TaxID=652676 RepID=A0A3B0ZIX6_9ZZZZ